MLLNSFKMGEGVNISFKEWQEWNSPLKGKGSELSLHERRILLTLPRGEEDRPKVIAFGHDRSRG